MGGKENTQGQDTTYCPAAARSKALRSEALSPAAAAIFSICYFRVFSETGIVCKCNLCFCGETDDAKSGTPEYARNRL